MINLELLSNVMKFQTEGYNYLSAKRFVRFRMYQSLLKNVER